MDMGYLRWRLGICLGLLLLAPVGATHGADLHFVPVDSVVAPDLDSIRNFTLFDIDGDGSDEIIGYAAHSTFIYAPSSHAMLAQQINPVAGTIGGICSYRDTSSIAIVLVVSTNGLLYRLDPVTLSVLQTDTIALFGSPLGSKWNLAVNDLNHDGHPDLIYSCLARYSEGQAPHGSEEWATGDLKAISLDSSGELWHVGGPCFMGYSCSGWGIPSAENLACVPSGDAGRPLIAIWGPISRIWYTYDLPYGWTAHYMNENSFALYNDSGNVLTSRRTSANTSVLAANVADSLPGNEILLSSGDTTTCFSYDGSALSTVWQASLGSTASVDLYQFPSLSNSFVAWDNFGHCLVRSGKDGHATGQVFGLSKGRKTSEIHRSQAGSSAMEIVQMTPSSLTIYSRTDPTNDDDPLANLPKGFRIEQNYPNPFNGGTTIRYALARTVQVKLDVVNMLGQVVVTLADGVESKGEKSVIWTGTDSNGHPVASGTYFAKISIGSESGVIKMTLLK